jgi:hypothetical protein
VAADIVVTMVDILATAEGNPNQVEIEPDHTVVEAVACHNQVVEAFRIVVVEVDRMEPEAAFRRVAVGVACRNLEAAFHSQWEVATNRTSPSSSPSLLLKVVDNSQLKAVHNP